MTTFVYSHDGSASTSDTFTYRINDGLGAGVLTDTASVTITITNPGVRFIDVPGVHTFYADIEWLATMGITRGCNPPTNTRFCPDACVTRIQMAAFLHRALK